ncbi:hypothetical protein EDB86DRAFT_3100033 [Lactarius hatsudake]|nr:hypothetical protein EDB86DRAFT_3100033 [Lactarius hatsudake]
MDGPCSTLEAPQLSLTQKEPERPSLMTSCDNCRLKQLKCVQVKSQPRFEACEPSNTPCQFRDSERDCAERNCTVTGSAGLSPARSRCSSSLSVERSTVSPTRGNSGHADVMENFSTNKANLIPVLPSTIKDSGYRGAVRVRISQTIGPLGVNLLSEPSYQSQRWTISAHPEGKRYAHIKSQTGITVVTEANVAGPGVADQLNAWLAVIYDTINEEHAPLLDCSDLFLEIHQDAGICNYYLANHGLRTVFWLHTLNTISVGLPPSYSSSCLQYSFEENYWIHVELFPGTASQYSAKALNDLQVVFFACPRRILLTAANHRFFIHSGKETKHGQLTSNQSILEVPESRWGLVLTIISKMFLFDTPGRYEVRFKSFWVDPHIDASRWREHVSEVVEDLKQTNSSILALLGASMPTSSSSGLIKASLFLCAFNLAVTSFLLQRQQRLLRTNIPTPVAYLKHWNTSYGLQPIAVVHCLPQALFIWSLLLFSLQGFWMVFADLPLTLFLSTLLPVAAILLMVGLGIWFVVHPRPEPDDATFLPAITPSTPAVEQKEVESMV